MRFLDEKGAVVALQSMLTNSDVATLVVAFWGKGAADRLGLTQRPWKQLTVVCNLSSGACNPDEIQHIRENVSNLRLRNLPSLHGKVYLTPEKVILGSSNASTNGLVIDGDHLTGWSEANIEADDPGMLRSCAEWCNKQFELGVEVTDEDITAARELWLARKNVPFTVSRQEDLFSACRANPDAFGLVDVVFWKDGLSTAAMAHLATLEGRNVDLYEGWGDRLVQEHWALDVSLAGKTPKLTGILKINETDENGMTYVRHSNYVLIQGRPRLTLSEPDKVLLENNASRIFQKHNKGCGVVITLAEVIAEIDAV